MMHRLAAIVLLGPLSFVAVARGQERKPEPADVQAAARQVVELTNELRKEKKLEPLTVDKTLQATAEEFAAYMAKHDKYGHEADGRRPIDRAKAHKYDVCLVTENIAYQFRSRGLATDALASRFYKSWETSPVHLANMLDADVTEIGVGIARSEKSGYYYGVQLFGRPRSQQIEFEIVNDTKAEISYRMGERELTLLPGYTRTHQRCRSAPLAFKLSPEKRQTVTPAPGETLKIVSRDGKLELRRE